MAQTQSVLINFSKGLDTKTDPWQVSIGNFLALQNSVFTKAGLLQKRNGYGQLTSLPDSQSTHMTTLNGNLTSIGNKINAYNFGSESWVSKGTIQPAELSTLSLIRNNLNQTQSDSAIAPNGLICSVYTEVNAGISAYKYAVADAITGQNIISPTAIPVASGTVTGSPRVFLLGKNFVVVFTNVISGTSHLQYLTVNSIVPTIVGTNTDIASEYVSFPGISWDGIVVNNSLYVAYNNTTGGQNIKLVYLTAALAISSPVTFTGFKATLMSVCADITNQSNPVIYANFYSDSSSTGYSLAVDKNLNTILNPIEIISSSTVANITSVAQNGTTTIYYEVTSAYPYDSAIPSNYINSISVSPLGTTFHSVFSSGASTISASSATGLSNGMYIVDNSTSANISAGTRFNISGTTLTLSMNTAGNSASSPGDVMTAATVSATTTILRSVGLASKAFIVEGLEYFLSTFQSPFQNSYFLINGAQSTQSAPVIVAKLAYENGGGYLPMGLPSVTVSGNVAQVSYLQKDFIAAQSLTTLNNTQQTTAGGIYSQTGIELATIKIGTKNIDTVEIANSLCISGGFNWMYDGYLPVEQNFFLWPDSIEVSTADSAVTPTGTTTSGSNVITAISSIVGVGIGASVTGTGIPADQVVTEFTSTTITFGPLTATGSHSAETITVTGNISTAQEYLYQATYEWNDNQGNIHRSAPSIPVNVTTSGTTSTNTVSIPTLRLTYKTANPVKIAIYRWSAAQQEYFQVTSLTSPLLNDTNVDSVTFVDCLSDAQIIGNNLIYTTGGVVEDVNAPASSLLTLFDTRAWLVDSEDPNSLWFSKQVIENTPIEWSDLFTMYIAPTSAAQGSTGPITALAPLDDKLIIFKQNAIYYINGTGPDNTGANNQYSQPIFITSTVGCANQQSIVFMPQGLMFQSDKGIWLLNRDLNTSYIGAPVEQFNSGIVQSAVNIPETNQVRFTISTGQTLMYDYYYGQWGTFVGVPAISSCIFQDLHTFINSSGQVYQESPGLYLDGSNPVLMSFTTSWLNLASLQGYERFYDFYILAKYLSPHFLLCQIAYDYNSSIVHQKLISPDNFSSSVPSPFGVPTPFGSNGNREQWRIHAKQQLCESFQLTITEVFNPAYNTVPGAGFTMSGITCEVGIKKATRPIRGSNAAGMS